LQTLPRLLDILLPLAVLTEAQVVCYYVPASNVTSPTSARLAWMKVLKEDNRLLLVMGIPKQAYITESSGICFAYFVTQLSRIEFYQDNNCILFAE
jgi:hypothetical protein